MSHYKTIQALGAPHVVHQGLIDFLDDFELAAMLGHLLYWSDKTDNPLGIYRSNDEWLRLFRFKDAKVKKLSDELQRRGLIIKTHKRLEHRIYYLFNVDEFDRQFGEFLATRQSCHDGFANPQNDDSPIAKIKIGESQNQGLAERKNGDSLYTKITTKITNKDYCKENEYAHAQTNDCQNSQQATPTNTADPVTKKQNDKTKPALATSPSTTKKFINVQDLISLGVEPQVANDYLAIRKTKLTQTALNGIAKQSALANMTLARAIEFAAEMGWQSFKADWYFNQMPKSAPPKQTAKVFDEFGNVVTTPHEPHPNSTEAYAIRLQRDAENLKKRLYGESV